MNEVRADYYKTRLSHTVEFTQRSTGHIYLVNGGILALLYFAVGSDRIEVEAKRATVLIGLAALFALNALHALFLHLQGSWYRHLRHQYAAAALAEDSRPEPPFGYRIFGGVHKCYTAIHICLALLALILLGYAWNRGTSIFAMTKPQEVLRDELREYVRTEVHNEGMALRAEIRSEHIQSTAPQNPPKDPK